MRHTPHAGGLRGTEVFLLPHDAGFDPDPVDDGILRYGAEGYEVKALQRTRIMHVRLGELPIGRWRNLSAQEVSGLQPRREKPAPRRT